MRNLILAALVVLVGCAAPQPSKPRDPVKVTEPAPRCSNKVECDRMWVAAQEQIQQLSGMRLRMVTDTRIETFPPIGRGQMTGGYVVKYPIEPDVYELRAEIFCRRNVECSDLRALGINAFNAGMYFSADPPWTKKQQAPAAAASAVTAPQTPASTPPNQARTAPRSGGKDTFNAEALARSSACGPQPVAKLIANGPGFETYAVPCVSGDTLAIRCEFGNCRVLR